MSECSEVSLQGNDISTDEINFDVLEKMALLDMTNDGSLELVLCFEAGLEHSYLVFINQDNAYSCVYFPKDRMRYLDCTGLYNVGDGITVASFTRMTFESELIETTIACWEVEEDYANWEQNFIGTIDGQPVTEDDFYEWEEANVKEEVEWIDLNTTE